MSSAGRCIACSTASGILVGPGIARNSRPARTTMLLPFVARMSEATSGESHIIARKTPGSLRSPGLRRRSGLLRGRKQTGKPLSPGLAATGGFGVIDGAEPARALGDIHLDL